MRAILGAPVISTLGTDSFRQHLIPFSLFLLAGFGVLPQHGAQPTDTIRGVSTVLLHRIFLLPHPFWFRHPCLNMFPSTLVCDPNRLPACSPRTGSLGF